MQYTTNYNLNKPEGTDLVNPLTIDNPNWESIDAAMYANKQNGVQTAQVALQETTIAITRDKSKPATFRFIATMNYATNMTITVDGMSVTATMPDGSALANNAFRIGSNVLCSLNGTSLTIYTNLSIDVNAIKVAVLQAVFPVGSIYTNINDSTNPGTSLGFGSWERIQGRFIFGASATYPAGSTGGEENHTLSAAELPSYAYYAYYWEGRDMQRLYNPDLEGTVLGMTNTGGTRQLPNVAGGDQPHNNMPPYLAAYMWKRVA